MTFGSRIKALRQQQGLTQEELSRRTGLTIGQLSRYENGLQPSIGSIVRLARAFNVDATELAAPVIEYASTNSPTIAST